MKRFDILFKCHLKKTPKQTKQSCLLLKTGDDHRWLHMITDALYMVKFKVSTVIVAGFYDV